VLADLMTLREKRGDLAKTQRFCRE